jgi:hypothetical protein
MAELLRPGVFSQIIQQQIALWLTEVLGRWSEHWFSAATELLQLDFNQELFGSLAPNELDVTHLSGLVMHFDALQLSRLIGGATGYSFAFSDQELDSFCRPLLAEALRDLSKQLDCTESTQYVLRARIKVGEAIGTLWMAESLVKGAPKVSAVSSQFTLSDAVADLALTLQMRLPVTGASFAQLQGLKVGMILSLQHAVDKPLPVHCGRQPVFNGYLVEQNQTKALYLTSAVRHLEHDKKPTN